ncbi:MAG: DUF2177 family protein [Polaromonas sp.]
MKYFAVYFAILVTLLLVDMLWLRVIAAAWYAQGLSHLMAASPNLIAAGAFYLLFPAGLLIFAVLPAENAALLKAVAMGALFGFFAYATYDLSNLATLKAWPVGLTLLDMTWGTLLSAMCAGSGKICLDALG